MNEKKLKTAFQKVKRDIFALAKDIQDLKNRQSSSTSKTTTSIIEDKKFDNLIKNLESELKTINMQLKDFEDKSRHNSNKIDLLANELEYTKRNYEKDTSMDTSAIEKEITLLNNQIIKLQTEVKQAVDKTSIFEDKLNDQTELLTEKHNMEINQLRLEFTEEIAKVYDKFFSEILDLKTEMNKKIQTKTEEKIKKTTDTPEHFKPSEKIKAKETKKEEPKTKNKEEKTKGEGKIKKMAKWLFIDEDEENEKQDMDDIKKNIK